MGVEVGLKHDSAILCDGLVSVAMSLPTDYVGSLSPTKTAALARALRVALHVEYGIATSAVQVPCAAQHQSSRVACSGPMVLPVPWSDRVMARDSYSNCSGRSE